MTRDGQGNVITRDVVYEERRERDVGEGKAKCGSEKTGEEVWLTKDAEGEVRAPLGRCGCEEEGVR